MKLERSEVKELLEKAKKYISVQALLNGRYPCTVKKLKVKAVREPHSDNGIYDFLAIVKSDGATSSQLSSMQADLKLALAATLDKMLNGRFIIVGDIEYKIK